MELVKGIQLFTYGSFAAKVQIIVTSPPEVAFDGKLRVRAETNGATRARRLVFRKTHKIQ